MKLLGWKKGREKFKSDKVLKVGVLGATRGAGTTHFAVMLANYYANGCGCKTCLIEFSGHKDYMKICDEASIEVSDIRQYSYKGIDFRVCDSTKVIANYMTGEYEVVIIDMAGDRDESLEELKRCDVRLLMGSTDMWRLGRLKKLLNELKSIPVSLTIFMGNQRELKRLQREYKVGIFEVPAEPDPLMMQAKTMYVLKQFMEKATGNYISRATSQP